MSHFGVKSEWNNGKIKIDAQNYKSNTLVIEPDWSSASYWYSFVSISDDCELFLKGYKKESLQGDSIVSEIYKELGVNTEFKEDGILLTKSTNIAEQLSLDFSDCPDIAQTLLVSCAFHKVDLKLTGLESLRIKETDRILAMQNELKKLNVSLVDARRSS